VLKTEGLSPEACAEEAFNNKKNAMAGKVDGNWCNMVLMVQILILPKKIGFRIFYAFLTC
jgi:hypothetical protein